MANVRNGMHHHHHSWGGNCWTDSRPRASLRSRVRTWLHQVADDDDDVDFDVNRLLAFPSVEGTLAGTSMSDNDNVDGDLKARCRSEDNNAVT